MQSKSGYILLFLLTPLIKKTTTYLTCTLSNQTQESFWNISLSKHLVKPFERNWEKNKPKCLLLIFLLIIFYLRLSIIYSIYLYLSPVKN